MDRIDRKICEIVQTNGKVSSAALAEAIGAPVSTTNDRLRRLDASGAIVAWRGVLDPERVGAGLCAFVFVDMAYEGEADAAASLCEAPEVLELHHISGAHSYLAKIRVADMPALQRFLTEVLKPLPAVQRTETVVALRKFKRNERGAGRSVG